MDDFRPLYPLMDHSEILAREKPQFQCASDPFVFSFSFDPVREVTRNILQNLKGLYCCRFKCEWLWRLRLAVRLFGQ